MEAKSIVYSVNQNVSNAKLQAQRIISHGEGVLNAGTQSLQSAKSVVVKGGRDVVQVVRDTAEELKRTLREGVNDVGEKLSRIATPSLGGPRAYSFIVASASGRAPSEADGTREVRQFTVTGGMCVRCEGRGSVSDFDLDQLFDKAKSLAEGALTVPA